MKKNETTYQAFSKFNLNSANKASNKILQTSSTKHDFSTKSLYLNSIPNLSTNVNTSYNNNSTNQLKKIIHASPKISNKPLNITLIPSLNNNYHNNTNSHNNKNNIINENNLTVEVNIDKKPQTANRLLKLNSRSGIDIQNINVKFNLYDKAKYLNYSNNPINNSSKYIKTFSYNSYQGTVRYILLEII